MEPHLLANVGPHADKISLTNGWFLHRRAQQIAGAPMAWFVTALHRCVRETCGDASSYLSYASPFHAALGHLAVDCR